MIRTRQFPRTFCQLRFKEVECVISLIAAVSKDSVIGFGGGLPWHLPADMGYFRRVTMGHVVIMGRKTFLSLPGPLQGRRNIVLSRSRSFIGPDGVFVAKDLRSAIYLGLSYSPEVFVIGGAEIFAEALPYAEVLYLTRVDVVVGDRTDAVLFPTMNNPQEWEWREVGAFPADNKNRHAGRFLVYHRVTPPLQFPVVYPSNARSGSYRSELEGILEKGMCPFCPGGHTHITQRIVFQNEGWLVFENEHPLSGSSRHFLIVVRRHVVWFSELSPAEWVRLGEVAYYLEREFGALGGALYGRSGDPLATGASVAHLHFQVLVLEGGFTQISFGPYPHG